MDGWVGVWGVWPQRPMKVTLLVLIRNSHHAWNWWVGGVTPPSPRRQTPLPCPAHAFDALVHHVFGCGDGRWALGRESASPSSRRSRRALWSRGRRGQPDSKGTSPRPTPCTTSTSPLGSRTSGCIVTACPPLLWGVVCRWKIPPAGAPFFVCCLHCQWGSCPLLLPAGRPLPRSGRQPPFLTLLPPPCRPLADAPYTTWVRLWPGTYAPCPSLCPRAQPKPCPWTGNP
jgi:hypothetical protein